MGNLVPSMNFGSIVTILIVVFVCIFFMVILVSIIFTLRWWYSFKFRVVVFERVGTRTLIKYRDAGRFIKMKGSQGFERIFQLRKARTMIPAPKLKVGPKEYWFYERSKDGMLHNFEIEDLDEKLKIMKVDLLDEDIIYGFVNLSRMMSHRYKGQNFWEKYGTMIGLVLFMIVVVVCLVVLFQRMEGITKALTEYAQVLRSMAINSGGASSTIPV